MIAGYVGILVARGTSHTDALESALSYMRRSSASGNLVATEAC
jgi:hypothetical protein